MNTKQAPEAGVLKLEIGKEYRSREGKRATVVGMFCDRIFRVDHERDCGWGHTANGRINLGLDCPDHRLDLIALWEEPAPAVDLSKIQRGDVVALLCGANVGVSAVHYEGRRWVISFEGVTGRFGYDSADGHFYDDGRTSIIDIIAIEPKPFDWKDVKPGMAFDCPPEHPDGNEHWFYFYAGSCPVTGVKLFAGRRKNGGSPSSASILNEQMIATFRRAPEHDITPESRGA